jgi:DNA helicase-2/ATP-dependent DNA helicase PcrA
MYFREIFKGLTDYNSPDFNIQEFDFAEVKDVNLKQTYSFTSHIAVYEECAVQYKFFKELGFTPTRVGATIFGTIVHETIEDVHRAVLRKEEHLVTPDNLRAWLEMNYATVSKAEHAYLGRPQIEAALHQVERYVERHQSDWSRIREAEVDVSLVKPNYILAGKIDLIRGADGTVEIVDFKSEKRPDASSETTYFDRYRRQLQVYAHLVEAKTGQRVSKMSLYYTGEADGNPMVTFPYVQSDVATTIGEFDTIVQKIQAKDFRGRSTNTRTCNNCDFRFYCKKAGGEING